MYTQQVEKLQNASHYLEASQLQIFDLKQLADMESAYRKASIRRIRKYKDWVGRHFQETDMIEILYGSIEGIMLRQQAEDAVKLYWIIRKDFRKAWSAYLECSCCYPSVVQAA